MVIQEPPTVTIVTPSYNQGAYIEETIRSVLSQDYPNLEYIVVDGGSDDNTLEILRKYEGRLRWISERDRGQADALNKGFCMARGELLGWLNSDDTYLPGALWKAAVYFRTHPDIDMLYGEGYHVDMSGSVIERYPTEPFDPQRLSEDCFICQPTVFFRAHVFQEVGPLDLRLRYCLDYDYWIRIAGRFRVDYLREGLATSRLHMDTKTLAERVEVHSEILRVIQRHYGRVSARWIYAYTSAYLTEKLMPNLHGLYHDGWASSRVRLFLRRAWQRYPYLMLEGTSPKGGDSLSLRIAINHHVSDERRITDRHFTLKIPLWEEAQARSHESMEITLHADKSFIPCDLGINKDFRSLAYRIRRLSLLDEHGSEVVWFSSKKTYIFLVALPLFFLWKSLIINHALPCKEILHKLHKLYVYIISRFL